MKWSEALFASQLRAIALMCAAGLLSWEDKEAALEDLLERAHWTRAELQDLNRRREAPNN